MSVDARTQKLFTELEAVWRSGDFSKMRSFWVKDLAAPLYLPEERKDFITTWADFDSYFAGTAKISKGGVQVIYVPLTAVPVSQGQQQVAFTMEWTMQLVTDNVPIGGSVRGVALMADDGKDWKLKSYIEAPLAPIVYMRELYEGLAKQRGFTSAR